MTLGYVDMENCYLNAKGVRLTHPFGLSKD